LGWTEVLVAPGKLVQVFVNLFLNAADAMEGEGAIAVACEARDREVLIRVSDEGPGVAEEHRRKIFDPFFTTKAVGQGTGLGLSVCRSIIESFGGTLELSPFVPGSGATFVIALPRKVAVEGASSACTPGPKP
jgi:two-component system NtrC family sensor kinase